MAKGFGINTRPVPDRAQRRRLILHGLLYAVIGSFLVFLLLSFLFMVSGDVREGQTFNQPFNMAIVFWITGAFLWGPALLISWLVENVALIKGRAGLVVALGWGALLGGGVLCLINLQNALAMAALGAMFGAVFSGPFWCGVSSKVSKIVD